MLNLNKERETYLWKENFKVDLKLKTVHRYLAFPSTKRQSDFL